MAEYTAAEIGASALEVIDTIIPDGLDPRVEDYIRSRITPRVSILPSAIDTARAHEAWADYAEAIEHRLRRDIATPVMWKTPEQAKQCDKFMKKADRHVEAFIRAFPSKTALSPAEDVQEVAYQYRRAARVAEVARIDRNNAIAAAKHAGSSATRIAEMAGVTRDAVYKISAEKK